MKIGIYDSGIGGLSVLHRALKKMPEAEFIYYADTKHVPYGEKTREQIKGYVEEVLNFLIAKEVDAIVIACNTATSVATKEFRGEFAVPIVGMEPAVKRALKLYQDMQKRILVTATPVTIAGEKLHSLLEKVDTEHEVDLAPLPKLVRFAEAGRFQDPEVDEYLKKLGDMPKLARYHFDVGTLYYKHKGKQQPKVFCFYDKRADADAKRLIMPDGFAGTNLLKYEMRLNGRLPQQIGVPEVQASTLSESEFYRLLVRKWQAHYFSISKLNQLKTEVMSEIKTVSDAFDVLVARLISQSDQSQITAFLEELKDAKVFDDRKCYTRLKKKIIEVVNKAGVSISDEDIRELDDEIKNVGAYV